MADLQLAVIDVKPGAAMESQSGLQLLRPRIFGAWMQPSGPRRAAPIVMHPASNFMGHYLIAPLAERGAACMGLNSRYAGNDTLLLMERVIQDLGAGVQYLRAQGYDKVVLVGNSGGAALAAFYQAQAEHLDIGSMPDGDPAGLSPQDLPPVQVVMDQDRAATLARQPRCRRRPTPLCLSGSYDLPLSWDLSWRVLLPTRCPSARGRTRCGRWRGPRGSTP